MKRLFSCALLLACLLAGCSQADSVKIMQVHANRLIRADSAEDLQKVSDLIVVFTPEDQENVLAYYSDGNVSVGYTKTSGIVSRVFSGAVSEGESILITEECYTTDAGSVLWTQQGYLPMDIGESYLLFLKAYSAESVYAGMYYPVDLEYGKYILPNDAIMTASDTYSAEQLEVGTETDLDTYIKWYDTVRSFYPELYYLD